MRELPPGRMLWLPATIMSAIIVANGCQSTSSLPAVGDASQNQLGRADGGAKQWVVRPGMEMDWAIKSTANQSGVVSNGRSIVGPDGTINMGPYGSCAVAGKTLEQASSLVEKHLAAYVKQPRVAMSVVVAAAPNEITWKKAASPLTEGLVQNQAAPNLAKDPLLRSVGFQPPETPKDGSSNVPALTIGDRAEPPLVQGQPASMKRFGKHLNGGETPPPFLQTGPSEMHPVLLPTYMIRSPDVLLIESQKGLLTQPVRGQHLVRPDGTVGVGIYGSVIVAGLTLEQAREKIAAAIYGKMAQMPYPKKDPEGKEIKEEGKTVMTNPPKLADVLEGVSVDVLAYNSAVYYIITDGSGLGEQVYRFPVTGNETVLDAIAHINGLSALSSRRIWVARRNAGHAGPESIYAVDWKGVTQMGAMNTNWQILPGDRVFVKVDTMRAFNATLSKFLEPVERVLGVTLLGGQAVNTIRYPNGNNTTNR